MSVAGTLAATVAAKERVVIAAVEADTALAVVAVAVQTTITTMGASKNNQRWQRQQQKW